jgi:hypothetical protein
MEVIDKDYSKYQFLLVEPIVKTPYPPLGLLKISSMLKDKYKGCRIVEQTGTGIPKGLTSPRDIFITSLFTWDWKHLVKSVHFYKRAFPGSKIFIGGIAASLLSDDIWASTGVRPNFGLYHEAEFYPPDYSLTFGRKIKSSICFTSRGCLRKCKFCSVKDLEPTFFLRDDWEKDISDRFNTVTFWDNNFLASPNFDGDCQKIVRFKKKVDFNQGLDARLYDEDRAKALSKMDVDPIRFAFDDSRDEKAILKAIRLAKKYSNKEIRVYVIYNFEDTPEDFYYRINLLNQEGVLSFPMEYRNPDDREKKFPGPHWNKFFLRALTLSLLFYYSKGMITESRKSFEAIYGKNAKEFVSKLYEIYKYDKARKATKKVSKQRS